MVSLELTQPILCMRKFWGVLRTFFGINEKIVDLCRLLYASGRCSFEERGSFRLSLAWRRNTFRDLCRFFACESLFAGGRLFWMLSSIDEKVTHGFCQGFACACLFSGGQGVSEGGGVSYPISSNGWKNQSWPSVEFLHASLNNDREN